MREPNETPETAAVADVPALAAQVAALRARQTELRAAIDAKKQERDTFMQEEMHPFTVRERAFAADIKAMQAECAAIDAALGG